MVWNHGNVAQNPWPVFVSRMTLLLGPPGSGKTSLLLALAGKLPHDLEVWGDASH